MATHLNSMVIEKIKSNRNKDKAVVNGFIYSLNRTSVDVFCIGYVNYVESVMLVLTRGMIIS